MAHDVVVPTLQCVDEDWSGVCFEVKGQGTRRRVPGVGDREWSSCTLLDGGEELRSVRRGMRTYVLASESEAGLVRGLSENFEPPKHKRWEASFVVGKGCVSVHRRQKKDAQLPLVAFSSRSKTLKWSGQGRRKAVWVVAYQRGGRWRHHVVCDKHGNSVFDVAEAGAVEQPARGAVVRVDVVPTEGRDSEAQEPAHVAAAGAGAGAGAEAGAGAGAGAGAELPPSSLASAERESGDLDLADVLQLIRALGDGVAFDNDGVPTTQGMRAGAYARHNSGVDMDNGSGVNEDSDDEDVPMPRDDAQSVQTDAVLSGGSTNAPASTGRSSARTANSGHSIGRITASTGRSSTRTGCTAGSGGSLGSIRTPSTGQSESIASSGQSLDNWIRQGMPIAGTHARSDSASSIDMDDGTGNADSQQPLSTPSTSSGSTPDWNSAVQEALELGSWSGPSGSRSSNPDSAESGGAARRTDRMDDAAAMAFAENVLPFLREIVGNLEDDDDDASMRGPSPPLRNIEPQSSETSSDMRGDKSSFTATTTAESAKDNGDSGHRPGSAHIPALQVATPNKQNAAEAGRASWRASSESARTNFSTARAPLATASSAVASVESLPAQPQQRQVTVRQAIEALIPFMATRKNEPLRLIKPLWLLSLLAERSQYCSDMGDFPGLLEEVAAVLRRWPRNVNVQRQGVVLLGTLAKARENHLWMARAGLLGCLERAMHQHVNDMLVFASCSLAVARLAGENVAVTASTNLIRGIVRGVQFHMKQPVVLEVTLETLACLAFDKHNGAVLAAVDGLTGLVVDAATKHAEIASVQYAGFRAIGHMCHSDKLRAQLRKCHRLSNHVVAVLRRHGSHQAVVRAVFQMIRNMAAPAGFSNAVKLVGAGFVEALLPAMREHAQSWEVQADGMRAVCCLANDCEARQLLGRDMELRRQLVASAKGHGKCTHLQLVFLAAIASLARADKVRQLLGLDMELRQQLVASAATHESNQRMQDQRIHAWFLIVVQRLARDDEVRSALGLDIQLRRQLCKCAKESLTNKDVQKEFLRAVHHLVRDDVACQYLGMDGELRRQLVVGARAHGQCEDVQCAFLGAICRLAVDDEVCRLLGQDEELRRQLVVGARAHGQCEEVQRLFLRVVALLARDSVVRPQLGMDTGLRQQLVASADDGAEDVQFMFVVIIRMLLADPELCRPVGMRDSVRSQLVACVEAHREHTEMHYVFLQAVSRLADDIAVRRLLRTDERLRRQVVASAAVHGNDKDVQQEFLRAVCNLTCDGEVCRLLGTDERLRLQVVASAEEHRQSEVVQLWFLAATGNLANADAIRRPLGMEVRVRRQLVAAAEAHRGDVDVQCQFLRAIVNLASDSDVRGVLGSDKRLRQQVMANAALHGDRKEVQQQLMLALASLSSQRDDVARQLDADATDVTGSGLVEVVLAGMQRHPDNALVSANGARVLAHFIPMHTQRIVNCRGGLATVIDAATTVQPRTDLLFVLFTIMHVVWSNPDAEACVVALSAAIWAGDLADSSFRASLDTLVATAVARQVMQDAERDEEEASTAGGGAKDEIASATSAEADEQKGHEDNNAEEAPAVHEGYRCDGCSVHPIDGTLYRSSVLPNYDVCEKCKPTITRGHPFVKVRRPCQMPAVTIARLPSAPSSPPLRNCSCGTSPITGTIFRCCATGTYLCSSCEATDTHPHALLEIPSPDLTPTALVTVVPDPDKGYKVGICEL